MIDKLLVVGHGNAGKRHLKIAKSLLPNSKICVMRHLDASSIPQHADLCTNSLSEALSFSPQAAVIANPSSHHIEIAQKLADNGVHLLIEKPISSSTEGVEDLIETSNLRKIAVLVAYNLRFLSSLQEYRRLILTGKIGRVMSVRCEVGHFLPEWRPNTNYVNSVSASANLGGGALLELSHEIDYLRWIFGEIISINAVIRKQSNLELNVEDTAHLIVELRNELYKKNIIASINLDFIRQDKTRYCIAIGENGTLKWDGITNTIYLFSPNNNINVLFNKEEQVESSYISEWHHFLSCVAGESMPLISPKDGLEVLKIIEAARCSSKENKMIKIS